MPMALPNSQTELETGQMHYFKCAQVSREDTVQWRGQISQVFLNQVWKIVAVWSDIGNGFQSLGPNTDTQWVPRILWEME